MFTGGGIFLAAVLPFFAVDGSMEENGWECGREQPTDGFTVKNGELTCRCSPNPMKGASYFREIAFPEVGELSYEVRLFVEGHTDRYVLQVDIGRLRVSFCGQSAIRYYPVPGEKYPNWTGIGKDRIPPREWTKVRLRWNTRKRMIKYYVGADQTVPSYVEQDVVIEPNEDGRYRLSVGNYGLHKDHEVHQLRNFELRDCGGEAGEGAKIPRDTAVVFSGLCSEYFPIEEWTKDFAAEKTVNFNLEYNGYNYTTVNRLSLSGYPDDELLARAKLIILCDMPLEKSVLPYSVQENLLAAVKDGARLLVTGGLAGLQRCGDFESPVAKALPCEFRSAFKEPDGGPKLACGYGKGRIVILNKRKVREPCIEQ